MGHDDLFTLGKSCFPRTSPQETLLPRVNKSSCLIFEKEINDKLLAKIEESDSEFDFLQDTPDDECVICMAAKATMRTFPCGHKVVCRKCFIKTIQNAVSQRCLPLRCVVCRERILKLRQSSSGQKTGRKSMRQKIFPRAIRSRHEHKNKK